MNSKKLLRYLYGILFNLSTAKKYILFTTGMILLCVSTTNMLFGLTSQNVSLATLSILILCLAVKK